MGGQFDLDRCIFKVLKACGIEVLELVEEDRCQSDESAARPGAQPAAEASGQFCVDHIGDVLDGSPCRPADQS